VSRQVVTDRRCSVLSGDVEIRRRTGLVTLIALLAAVGWFAAAQSAAAGGPTSVLLANPQTGRASALYYTDKAYDQLAGAVGAFVSEAGSTNKPAAVTDDLTGEIRLTWLIHDMSIWRIDRVHAPPKTGCGCRRSSAPTVAMCSMNRERGTGLSTPRPSPPRCRTLVS
jgi:hypothetical protein